MTAPALEFQNISKKFRRGEGYDSLRDLLPGLFSKTFGKAGKTGLREKEFWALNDVSFRVGRGEALGIVGPNGSGKSTTLKLLSGILKPTAGAIQVNGRISALIEVGAGFHPDLTGRENIFLNGAILGMSRSETQRKLDAIIEFSGIPEFIDTPVKRYSSGMYARLGFSIAAHVEPEILLVDEVLSVGDYTFQGRCIRKMNEVLKSGTTVIFVSHNMESVLSLCDRAILLVNGKISREGEPAAVIAEYCNAGGVWAPKLCERKKAAIRSVTFEGVDSFSKAVPPGTRLKCKMAIECLESCRVSPGLFLTQFGGFVFDTTYGRMNGAPMALSAGETAEVVWSIDLNLPNGSYDLGVHLEDGDSGLYHEHNFRVVNLLIANDFRYEGKYILNPTISVSR
ncbi:MAG TPA: polysaccharide ABC transporter ATP-binding protein [Candidatus Deferrimicrobiaceae bacterium]|nr:polysaccharide ABC transporter ATP-binding protein [Candidatus Deferrimicrobiaceae bacterium]